MSITAMRTDIDRATITGPLTEVDQALSTLTAQRVLISATNPVPVGNGDVMTAIRVRLNAPPTHRRVTATRNRRMPIKIMAAVVVAGLCYVGARALVELASATVRHSGTLLGAAAVACIAWWSVARRRGNAGAHCGGCR